MNRPNGQLKFASGLQTVCCQNQNRLKQPLNVAYILTLASLLLSGRQTAWASQTERCRNWTPISPISAPSPLEASADFCIRKNRPWTTYAANIHLYQLKDFDSVWDQRLTLPLKPGFHYTSWRPESRVDGWPVSITRQLGPSTRVVETGLITRGVAVSINFTVL